MKGRNVTRGAVPFLPRERIGIFNWRKTAEQTAPIGRSLRPLTRLFPYILRYRSLVTGAIAALVLAAAATLALPLAVRRMIDNGFSGADSSFINSYFTMLLFIAALLAVASAMRYYFVITIGERVVSDLRRDVFNHVTALSPEFFRRQPVRRDRFAPERRHHADQIAVGASASMPYAIRSCALAPSP